MASGNGKDKGDSVHSMVTPLASTRDAPFVIQSENEPRHRGNSTGTLAHKLRSKTVVGSDLTGRSTRSDSNQSTRSQQQQYAKGEWNTSFSGCLDCCHTGVGSFLLLACCPCFSAAKVHSMLGSSFEFGVLYFGGLVFGMVISLGLSFSNNTAGSVGSSSTGGNTSRSSGYVRDDAVAQEADPTTVNTGSTTASDSMHLYNYFTLLLLALFLLGIAFLRTKARHRFNIPGYRALDCVLSTVCCWCVLSQTQAHIEKNNRYEFGLDTPPDTLPAYL